MKNFPNHKTSSSKALSFGVGCSALALALTPLLSAQSPADFNTDEAAPSSATNAAPEQVAELEEGAQALSDLPSRYAGDDHDSYVKSIADAFSMKNRSTDPFGYLQDPDAQPVVRTPVVANRPRAAEPVTPFPDIVRLIPVTTVIPGEKQFLSGTRSIKVGDEIPVRYRGRQLRITVEDVTSRQIVFRNIDTGETGVRTLDMLPPGMTPGNKTIIAPGMQPAGSGVPLELDNQ